jgi:hypothetical protein
MKELPRTVRNAYILAASVFLVSIFGMGQAAPDNWLIVSGDGTGPLNRRTTHEDLVRIYGGGNVVERDGIDGMSGDTVYATVLFPDDAERTIEIQWRDSGKKAPAVVTVRGGKSRWHTVHGISLGTSLKDLEHLNGRPFHMCGFGWDYSGTITSWEKGQLTPELDAWNGSGALLRIDSAPRSDISEKEMLEVTGDRDFSSHYPIMQKLNPKVYEMTWNFSSFEQK